MKNYILCILLFFVVIYIDGCNGIEKKTFHSTGDCSIDNNDSAFESNFYPFNEKEYKTSNMLKYFKKGVKIDSGFNQNSNGDTVLYYRYYDDSSQLIFSLDNYSKKKFDYNIASFSMGSSLIEIKNGIKLNMARQAFFNTIDCTLVNCDTFDISNKYKSYYFRIIFKNDRLSHISKEFIIM